MANDVGHQATWNIIRDGQTIRVTFRQGETVQDCGNVEVKEEDTLFGWMFHADAGAKQYDVINAPTWGGVVLEFNDHRN
jgi:hypothetical protein